VQKIRYRDNWLVVSDAVMDYYNTRKLAFHYIQRVSGHLLICRAETSILKGHGSIRVINRFKSMWHLVAEDVFLFCFQQVASIARFLFSQVVCGSFYVRY
jgi:hypothetical protein